MERTITDFLFLVQRSITWCYMVIVPLYVLFLLLKNKRPGIINILSAINFCLGLLAFFNLYALVLMIVEISRAPSHDYFTGPGGRMLGAMTVSILGLTIIETGFLLKMNWRRSWSLSLVALLLVNWYLIYHFIAGLMPGALSPDVWQTSYSASLNEILLRTWIFIALVLLSFVVLAYSGKLPFPTSGFFSKRSRHVQ